MLPIKLSACIAQGGMCYQEFPPDSRDYVGFLIPYPFRWQEVTSYHHIKPVLTLVLMEIRDRSGFENLQDKSCTPVFKKLKYYHKL